MAEYIDRIEAIKAIDPSIGETTRKIKRIPSADVSPVVHSRWTIPGKVKDIWICENCGYGEGMKCNKEQEECDDEDVDPYWNYCPYCGAKMDKEEK